MHYRTSSFLWLFVAVGAAVGASGGCASTKIVDTWKDPAFKGPIDFRRTLVVAIHPDQYARNVTEDTIVDHIGTTRAVAGHDLLTDAERKGAVKLMPKLTQSGIDGVITIAVVGTAASTSRDSMAGDSEPFYTYYDRSSAFVTSDAGGRTDNVWRVETRIYDVKTNRVIWMAHSDTVNPENARTATQDIAKAVGGELRRQKLLR
jgi:hypothetical protein